MKRILIVGAGGFGREMYSWALQHPDCGRAWEIGGFINDIPTSLDGFNLGAKIVGTIVDYKPANDDLLLMAIGDSEPRKMLAEKLLARGAKFLTFVHPSVIVGQNAVFGNGVVICPRCVISTHVLLGDFVMCNVGSTCGHDAVVGSYSTLSGQCELTGRVHLGEGVFLGSGARIIPGRKIGDWARLGAGSVVIGNVPAKATMFGNPAKRIS